MLSFLSAFITGEISHKMMPFNFILYEPPHDTINKMACALSEDSDQPGHQRLRCALNSRNSQNVRGQF